MQSWTLNGAEQEHSVLGGAWHKQTHPSDPNSGEAQVTTYVVELLTTTQYKLQYNKWMQHHNAKMWWFMQWKPSRVTAFTLSEH